MSDTAPAPAEAEAVAGAGSRVAFVTGASGGIGAAIARALVANGHQVALGYGTGAVAADKLAAHLAEQGGTAIAIRCDVTDPASVDDAFSTVESELGRVELLVNAAGANRDKLLVQLRDDDWHRTIDVDLTGAFLTTRRALRSMIRARFGRVVQVGSVTASLGSAGQANYAAAKAGLVGLSRSVAREVATRNITVNVVEPGPIATAMIDLLPAERREAIVNAVPAGRLGTPEEVAALVAFLCSNHAGYVTGAVIPVDGGLGMGR